MHIKQSSFIKRKKRVRYKLRSKTKVNHYRLSIFKSNRYIYGQLIDDNIGKTIVSVSTKEKELSSLQSKVDKEAASEAGKIIAKRAIKEGIKSIYFDRGGYLYHGKVKEFADAARKAGLNF